MSDKKGVAPSSHLLLLHGSIQFIFLLSYTELLHFEINCYWNVFFFKEFEKPKPDKLHGLRVHCWVLVLSGKREVPESFFIETLTGNCHPLTHSAYLGIESVWNHKNYWVNMQDCSHGVQVPL